MSEARHEVVVVGGGAAGIAATIALARGGVPVALIESDRPIAATRPNTGVYFADSLAEPDVLGPDEVRRIPWERKLHARGLFSANGRSLVGVTYQDPETFPNCYIADRSRVDGYLANRAQELGARVYTGVTALGLIRQGDRVIGVSTDAGAVYSKVVFLAEGDGAMLVSKEGYERAASGRQDPYYVMAVQQLIHCSPKQLEEALQLSDGGGIALDIFFRNGTFAGQSVPINIRGMVITNSDSLSIGFMIPLQTLQRIKITPGAIMQWILQIPEIQKWTGQASADRPVARLLRAGGWREMPQLVDNGVAIGGAATGIGSDFPYLNYTGAASAQGLAFARAVLQIRSTTRAYDGSTLREHYCLVFANSHWWKDARHLKNWPSYLQRTEHFFDHHLDLLHGSLHNWAYLGATRFTKWRRWIRLVRRTTGFRQLTRQWEDSRHFARSLGLQQITKGYPTWRLIINGLLNAARELTGKKKKKPLAEKRTAHGSAQQVDSRVVRFQQGHSPVRRERSPQLRFHYFCRGERIPLVRLPLRLRNWAKRITPVLSDGARDIWQNQPVPVQRKLGSALGRLADEINLADIAIAALVALLLAGSMALQVVKDKLWAMLHRPLTAGSSHDFWRNWFRQIRNATRIAYEVPEASSAIRHRDHRLLVRWPVLNRNRLEVVAEGPWNVCPANVFATQSASQPMLEVFGDSCIHCQACWRSSDLIEWLPGSMLSQDSITKPIEDQSNATGSTPLQLDSDEGRRVLAIVDRLVRQVEEKLDRFRETVFVNRSLLSSSRQRWAELQALFLTRLGEELVAISKCSALASSPLATLAASLNQQLKSLSRSCFEGHFGWALADVQLVKDHHVAQLLGLTRQLDLDPAGTFKKREAVERWLAWESQPSSERVPQPDSSEGTRSSQQSESAEIEPLEPGMELAAETGGGSNGDDTQNQFAQLVELSEVDPLQAVAIARELHPGQSPAGSAWSLLAVCLGMLNKTSRSITRLGENLSYGAVEEFLPVPVRVAWSHLAAWQWSLESFASLYRPGESERADYSDALLNCLGRFLSSHQSGLFYLLAQLPKDWTGGAPSPNQWLALREVYGSILDRESTAAIPTRQTAPDTTLTEQLILQRQVLIHELRILKSIETDLKKHASAAHGLEAEHLCCWMFLMRLAARLESGFQCRAAIELLRVRIQGLLASAHRKIEIGVLPKLAPPELKLFLELDSQARTETKWANRITKYFSATENQFAEAAWSLLLESSAHEARPFTGMGCCDHIVIRIAGDLAELIDENFRAKPLNWAKCIEDWNPLRTADALEAAFQALTHSIRFQQIGYPSLLGAIDGFEAACQRLSQLVQDGCEDFGDEIWTNPRIQEVFIPALEAQFLLNGCFLMLNAANAEPDLSAGSISRIADASSWFVRFATTKTELLEDGMAALRLGSNYPSVEAMEVYLSLKHPGPQETNRAGPIPGRRAAAIWRQTDQQVTRRERENAATDS